MNEIRFSVLRKLDLLTHGSCITSASCDEALKSIIVSPLTDI